MQHSFEDRFWRSISCSIVQIIESFLSILGRDNYLIDPLFIFCYSRRGDSLE